MNDLGLKNDILTCYKPFLEAVLDRYRDIIHSIHIVGSALTPDYDPKTSDINSVIVLDKMDLNYLEDLAPLGKKFGKKRIAAPLIMTPEYIRNSLDVFPIEFSNIKLLHHTVFGEDIFIDVVIEKSDLRYQCERELKVKLISLRQSYISSAGDTKILNRGFIESIVGYIPLFKAIIVLLGKQVPQKNDEVLAVLEVATGVQMDAFKKVLIQKKRKAKLSIDQLNLVFEDYYKTIEKLGEITDALED